LFARFGVIESTFKEGVAGNVIVHWC